MILCISRGKFKHVARRRGRDEIFRVCRRRDVLCHIDNIFCGRDPYHVDGKAHILHPKRIFFIRIEHKKHTFTDRKPVSIPKPELLQCGRVGDPQCRRPGIERRFPIGEGMLFVFDTIKNISFG